MFFKEEFELFEKISSINYKTEIDLYEALKINKNYSLLEVYKPHLILYVLPKIIETNSYVKILNIFKIFLKICIQNPKSFNINIITDSDIINKKVGFVNFSKNFFEESLKKIIDYDKISSLKFFEFHKGSNFSSPDENFLSIIRNLQIFLDSKIFYENTLNLNYLNRLLLKLELKYFFQYNLHQIANVYNNNFETNLNHLKLVVANDFADPLSRNILLKFKHLGVPTMIVQQGITSYEYPEWKFNFSDYTVVSGIESQKHVIFQNPVLKNVLILGIPNFDTDYNKINFTKSNKKIKLLIATQPYFPYAFESKFQRLKIFYSIIFLALKNKKLEIILKPHPSEKKYIYNIFNFFNSRLVLMDKKENIYQLITHADIFITSFSQTSIYSILNNIPTINVYLSKNKCHADFIYSGASLSINTYHDLQRCLKNINFDTINEYQKNINKLIPWIYIRDGKASERILKVINSIINV